MQLFSVYTIIVRGLECCLALLEIRQQSFEKEIAHSNRSTGPNNFLRNRRMKNDMEYIFHGLYKLGLEMMCGYLLPN